MYKRQALNAILDEMGLHIVADDVAAQSRQYRPDAPERDDALNALAEKFAAMGNCSVLYLSLIHISASTGKISTSRL